MKSKLNLMAAVCFIVILTLPVTFNLFAGFIPYTPKEGTFEELVLSELHDFPFSRLQISDYRVFNYYFDEYRGLPFRETFWVRQALLREHVESRILYGEEANNVMGLLRNAELVSYIPKNRHPCNEHFRLTFSRVGFFNIHDTVFTEEMRHASGERVIADVFAGAGSMYVTRVSQDGRDSTLYFRFSGFNVYDILNI